MSWPAPRARTNAPCCGMFDSGLPRPGGARPRTGEADQLSRAWAPLEPVIRLVLMRWAVRMMQRGEAPVRARTSCFSGDPADPAIRAMVRIFAQRGCTS